MQPPFIFTYFLPVLFSRTIDSARMPNRPPKPTIRAIDESEQASGDSLRLPTDFGDYKVACLPVISNFLQKLGVASLVDTKIASPQNIGSGQVVVGMVMDTLAGRSPLYKLHEFFLGQDMELLFGSDLEPGDFNDNNVGKVLDAIHAYGASKLFSQLSWQACQRYDLDSRFLHYDTTSVSVHGDYTAYEEATDRTVAITYGHSKDKRPDMKQFMMEALCVKGSVPLLGAVLSGNTSDKKANNAELSRVASHLKKNGLDSKAHIYVADSALVGEDNLQALLDQPFITRLPANYKVEQAAIEAAAASGNWTDFGVLAANPDPSKARTSARYKAIESTVAVHGRSYRAIVAHSSSHDKRRTRKLEKTLAAEKEAFAKQLKAIVKETFHCEDDARNRAERLLKENRQKYHQIEYGLRAQPVYARGRPPAGKPRRIQGYRHHIELRQSEQTEIIAHARELAGCFVLISNVPQPEEDPEGLSAEQILRAYKEQNGVEMNFRFLKDPLIVNDTFLKKAERIEALGCILLLSLMVWNLIQQVIREHIAEHEKSILGWDRKQTYRPTTLMVVFYFQHISIFKWNQGRSRRLSRPLLPHQRDYLQALGLSEDIWTTPVNTIQERPKKRTNKLLENDENS